MLKEESQWNDAQIRFGPYDSTMTNENESQDPTNSVEEEDSNVEEEEFGASSDLHLDQETFTFVFENPWGKDDKIHIELRGYQSKSNITYCSTGLTMWPAAENLCDHIVKHPNLVAGKRVLELGSGLGLCGLLAHKIHEVNANNENQEENGHDKENGNAYVHLTDGDTDTLAHLRRNITLNTNSSEECAVSSSSSSSCECSSSSPSSVPCNSLSCNQLLWSRENSLHFLKEKVKPAGEKFDIILASDTIYAMSVIEPMWDTVQTLLKPGGCLLFAFARRQVAVSIQDVLDAGESAGFMHEPCEETNPDENLFVYIFRRRTEHE